MECDVAVIGGGPGGSSLGIYLKKFNPSLRVAIFEREIFPRPHVGESQLPVIAHYLAEMGVWEQVEAANFPIKIGATFRWGTSQDLWYFNFLRKEFEEEERPAPFEGQRQNLAFQVDRAIYDKILLDYAESVGCDVHQNTKVVEVQHDNDKVSCLKLASGEAVAARYYVDASGHAGILRRSLGVEATSPTSLQNVAFWDYWENAKWAETVGKSGTRVQVMSLGYGWIWFIPVAKSKVSVGLVTSAEYFKKCGKRPADLYAEAINSEPRIAALMAEATSEGKFETTKDWSFLASRMVGENWFLVGESAGFADPILAAGLTITHTSAREAAFTILELDRSPQEANWMKSTYERRLSKRILNHIRFADYWYSANEQFTDLKDFTKQIAEDNGLILSPDEAWKWLAQGGFIDEDKFIGNGGITLSGIRDFAEFLYGGTPNSPLSNYNRFELNLDGAELHSRAVYVDGGVQKEPAYLRGNFLLPCTGVFGFWIEILRRASRLPDILRLWEEQHKLQSTNPFYIREVKSNLTQSLEAMILEGWVKASHDPNLPLIPVKFQHQTHKRVTA